MSLDKGRKLLISSAIIFSGILLGRIMGFIREVSIASIFGISRDADILVLVLSVPDLVVGILVGGGLSAALIPEFRSLSNRRANILFIQSSLIAAAFFTLLVVALNFRIDWLVRIFAPGFSSMDSIKTQTLLSYFLWMVPLTVLAGISTARLHSQERFVVPSMGAFILNLSLVVGIWIIFVTSSTTAFLALFAIGGAFLRWMSQLIVLPGRLDYRIASKPSEISLVLVKRYLQALLATGVVVFIPVVARSIASFYGEGALALFHYSWRLIELPLSTAVTVLSVILLPRLSTLNAESQSAEFNNLFSEGVRYSLLVATVILIPLIIAPDIFVNIVYGWSGALSPKELGSIAELTRYAALVLPLQAFITVAMASFNARKQTGVNMGLSLITISLLVPLSYVAGNEFGLVGIVFSIVLSLSVMVLAFLIVLRVVDRNITRDVWWSCLTGLFVSFCLGHLVLSLEFTDPVSLVLLMFSMVASFLITIISHTSMRQALYNRFGVTRL